MALAKSVEESLKEAESNLRNALSYAARTERSFVLSTIGDLIHKIDTLISTDFLIDKLEDGKDDSGENFWDLFKEE